MKTLILVFPHQLFEDTTLLQAYDEIWIIEEYLFFKQYPFHKQKIAFHRASMKYYDSILRDQGLTVKYLDSSFHSGDIRAVINQIDPAEIGKIGIYDPADYWLEKRICETAQDKNIQIEFHSSPLFINSKEDLSTYFRSDKKKFFQTEFYKNQRKSLNILMDGEHPVGGKWTFDTENRKKYPKGKTPPKIGFPHTDTFYDEAIKYVETNFSSNYGELPESPRYPFTHEKAKYWLKSFLEERLDEFGPYEDAIVQSEHILNHSVLTPMLNVGLLTPKYILEQTIKYAEKNDVRINSLEGFIRQMIGWREFMRGIYIAKGVFERTHNFWGFSRKIPESFYTGKTGILPIDDVIQKVLKTGYAHHIERLMVLGNFMLLCEFDPKEVYRWFMELFIDAYDWVMVPNVYGMSQFADGGLMTTKPYFSSSNYIRKMSDYKKDEWCEIWDALFWRFMHVHRDFISSNPRMGMLLSTFDKKSKEDQNRLIEKANEFLETLN